MNKIKWPFLFLAIACAACMIATGIAISYRSAAGTIISLLLMVFFFGLGFSMKKKLKQKAQL